MLRYIIKSENESEWDTVLDVKNNNMFQRAKFFSIENSTCFDCVTENFFKNFPKYLTNLWNLIFCTFCTVPFEKARKSYMYCAYPPKKFWNGELIIFFNSYKKINSSAQSICICSSFGAGGARSPWYIGLLAYIVTSFTVVANSIGSLC